MIRTSKHAAVALVATIAATTASAGDPNLVLNGGFENNTADTAHFNLSNESFNQLVSDVTAFGDAAEIDLMTSQSQGFPPIEGDWKIGLHRNGPGSPTDAIAMHLTNPLKPGAQYTVGFAAHVVLTFDPDRGPVEVGISNSPTTFGSLVYSSPLLPIDEWGLFTSTFTADSDANFLTIRVGDTESWIHLDDVSLTLVPTPGAIGLVIAGSLAHCVTRRRHSAV